MKEEPAVSIIILNWNGINDTVECIESFKEISYKNYVVIIVDNHSDNNEAKELNTRFTHYIRLVESDRNCGYAGGVNIGIKYALNNFMPEYILVMNNDTVVEQDFLSRLIETSKGDIRIGVSGPKVCFYDAGNVIQSAGGHLNMSLGMPSLIDYRKLDNNKHQSVRDVDFVSGCCMLIKVKTIRDIGLIDEKYFCYWEETDFCVKARNIGYRVVCVPSAKVRHKNPGFNQMEKLDIKERSSLLLSCYYLARNRILFMKKYTNKIHYVFFILYSLSISLLYSLIKSIFTYGDLNYFFHHWSGVLDGINNVTGAVEIKHK